MTILIVAVILLSSLIGSQQAPVDDTDNLDTLINNFKLQFDEASNTVTKAIGGESNNDVLIRVKTAANGLADQFNQILSKISEEAKKHEPQVKQLVQEYENNIRKFVYAKLDDADSATSAQKIEENLTKTINKVLEESRKLEENLKNDASGVRADITKFTNEMVDKAIADARRLQQSLSSSNKAS